MPKIEQAIYDYLVGIDDLTDVVNINAIARLEITQTTAYPRLVFKNIDKPVLYEMPDEWQRWRFYILANDPYTAVAIGRILDTNFEGLTGTMGDKKISYVTKLADADPEFQEVQNMWELIQDYRFIFI